MILDIYKLLFYLQAKINGNPEISFSIAKEVYYLKVLWYEEEKKFQFKYQFAMSDVISENEDFILETLIARINREYAQKQLEERDE